MKILILGATGFIGSEIARKLASEGHNVTGLGRSVQQAQRKWPELKWQSADLVHMGEANAWKELVETHDAIVNCAGALQDGLSDNLSATQESAMLALYQAAQSAGGKAIIQISARTTGAASALPFLATKRNADEALAKSGLPYVILRPALVIGRNAHGGTALLRALASMPRILPLTHARSPVQTVAIGNVAQMVLLALSGSIPSGSDIDLAADERHTLGSLVLLHRQWLGLPAADVLELPDYVARPVSWIADLAGRLGWRSPLRSTAMAVMSEGVISTSKTDARHYGVLLKTAQQTLQATPSAVQDLWFARLYLLKPIIILCLSLFWLLSGLIPLFDIQNASSHFLPFMPQPAAITVTLATCLMDLALGLGVLVRPFAKKAMVGMLLVTASYLAGGTLLEPQLWLDPLGPLVKVLPSILLTLVALAISDER
ncbi:SDR family oxidoreductase [Agrobacterium sp.]|uniref:SDR family oxidoreductase n=1 Tax=Agrobacterium sp. TaxID=361 RepID=UPI0028A8B8C3|nr:SDR family oxidoreductase [Agrobacterium sp.]